MKIIVRRYNTRYAPQVYPLKAIIVLIKVFLKTETLYVIFLNLIGGVKKFKFAVPSSGC